jgi:hypothetical protein
MKLGFNEHDIIRKNFQIPYVLPYFTAQFGVLVRLHLIQVNEWSYAYTPHIRLNERYSETLSDTTVCLSEYRDSVFRYAPDTSLQIPSHLTRTSTQNVQLSSP